MAGCGKHSVGAGFMSTVGVDTGGTFTDLVRFRSDGSIEIAKRPSTPPNFADGIMDVVRSVDGGSFLGDVGAFYHGTTATTNAMITGSGAKVGLITTAGHGDVLPMMRILGRSAGKSESELKQYTFTDKPAPLVTKPLIMEVNERVDRSGRVVVALDEKGARSAVRQLIDAGAESIAVCFLWSFMNRDHELRMRDIAEEEAPGIHVSISSDIAPAIKEYERSATTAVNAYLAPLLSTYLGTLESQLSEAGLDAPVYVMQSLGGAMRVRDAHKRAVNTLVSGPAGGVVAAKFAGEMLGHSNIICADVGGTSFDVGLIVDGEPVIASTSVINQYTVLVPTVDIVSIGAGGGSVASVDLGRLRVGPRSAGAIPGPACYGRGGEEPTVTDADVVLGYIDPEYFLGGELELNRDLAERAIREKIAEPLGMTLLEAAAGIVEIANHHMSDLIRKMTIERGYDPRDFVVYAFGGAGPLHGAAFAKELGAKEVVFPLGNTAAAFSALGLAVSDLTTITQITDLALAPFDAGRIGERFDALELEARGNLEAPSDDGAVTVHRVVELRYKGQVHQVDTPVPNGPVTDAMVEAMVRDFEQRYEALFGPGSSFSEAGIELVSYRVLATSQLHERQLERASLVPSDASAALVAEEDLYWNEARGAVRTKIYDARLAPGMQVSGPAVIRLAATTVLIPPGQNARVDEYQNIRVTGNEVESGDSQNG